MFPFFLGDLNGAFVPWSRGEETQKNKTDSMQFNVGIAVISLQESLLILVMDFPLALLRRLGILMMALPFPITQSGLQIG